MIESILQSWSSFVSSASGGNQMIAGAISLWLLGTVTWFSRSIPSKLFEFIKRHFTTTMTLNNSGWTESYTMAAFMAWLQPQLSESMSRTLSISHQKDDIQSPFVGIGYGIHFFFFEGRFFWLNKSKLESSGSERQKEEISIGTIGRSHAPFKKIVQAFSPKKSTEKIDAYRLDSDGDWMKSGEIVKRPIESIAMSDDIKNSIIDKIQYMKDNPEWFASRGIPYKMTFLLHGLPGTGKTSMIKAIASHFNMNVCLLNIMQISDSALQEGLASTPPNSVVVIEDFDSSNAVKDREPAKPLTAPSGKMDMSMLSMTGVLNALDGIIPLHDCILFLTTNHLEHIDDAVYRDGRVDKVIEIGDISPADVRRYVSYIFPDSDLNDVEFLSTRGCYLNRALLEGKFSIDDFLLSLEKSGCIKLKKEKAHEND